MAVKETYGKVATNASERKATSCCGNGTSKDAITRDLYTEADTAGLPVEGLLAASTCLGATKALAGALEVNEY